MLNQQHRSNSPAEEPPTGGKGHIDELAMAMEGGTGTLSIAELPEVKKFTPEGSQTWRWLLLTLMGCIATSGAAVGAFVWLINLPPTANCENPASINTDRAQLYCAQVAAETGNLEDILTSLALIGSWGETHPLHYEVQPLVEQWSWVALKEAQQKLNDSDLNRAIELIDYIPIFSPVYNTAQESLQAWNAEWDQGNAIWQEAQTALQNQDWATASKKVIALSELRNQHWRVNQVQALSQQIRQERRARQQLATAVEAASGGGVAQLGGALRTVSQIDDSTYAYQAAQPYMDRWSDWLLNLGLDQWYASNLDEAISLGHNAAVNPNRAKAAQELIWLSKARQMAQQSIGTWRTSPDQLIKLYRAMVVANQIAQDSPYYPQAQSSVATWRTHLADLGKLQMAQLPGRLQHLETLKLAIDQAAQVPLGNPRRQQAQTLIAHWRLEVERLEDRPYLTKAHQLAESGTIEGLQQAIASASNIPLNRALRNEAQSWIYVWNHQIEVRQDRPTLTAARQLAGDGNYSQAIAKASNIKIGRALFDEAQAAIAGWRQDIYAIERARQRALSRAAARRRQVETSESVATPSPDAAPAVTDEQSAPTGDGTPVPSAAPAPTQPPTLRRPVLPRRIETVPEEPPAGSSSPSSTVQPGSSASPTDSGRDVPESADAVPNAPQPGSPPGTDFAPAPLPIDADSSTTPEFSLPIPAAPTPQLPAAPQPVTQPQPVPQPQDNTTAPTPTPTTPEALGPSQPSVSAAPTPEQSVRPTSTRDTGVLSTGALYAMG